LTDGLVRNDSGGIDNAKTRMMPTDSPDLVVDSVVLWDFDGTLAWRPGLWSGCVIEVLDELAPGHTAEIERVRAALKGGFPWDRHTQPHPELSGGEAWRRAEAFRVALHACGDPPRRWMVGNNPLADIGGAEALGIPAILVRTASDARRRAPDAAAAARLIVASGEPANQAAAIA
jgi:phosphoglycolate phosphatase-like HAD superfamily hydrolase